MAPKSAGKAKAGGKAKAKAGGKAKAKAVGNAKTTEDLLRKPLTTDGDEN